MTTVKLFTVASAFALSVPLLAVNPEGLPRDAEKEAWVRDAIAQVGLKNDIRVVRDDTLKGTRICAYATVRGGYQYIGFDPTCVTSLELPPNATESERRRYLWNCGVMLHEIAHHVAAHVTVHGGKTTIEQETEAERWVGWAFHHRGLPLEAALIYASQGQLDRSATHPGRPERLIEVENAWRQAEALAVGSTRVPPTPAIPPTSQPPSPPPVVAAQSEVQRLAATAVRQLRVLGRSSTAAR